MRKKSTIVLRKKKRKPQDPQKRGGKKQHDAKSADAILDLIDSGWLAGWPQSKVTKMLKRKGGAS